MEHLPLFFVGIVSSHYNARFKVNRQLSLSILRQFGFGQRVMESRILTEVEEMINKIREEKGRPFNPKELSTSCVVNVVMLMLLGYRFDHTNQDFVKLKWGIHEAMATYSIFLDLFPTVRHIPYFKKMIKYYLSLSKTIRTTINSLLDRCLEVCNSTSWREKFSHWPPWASKMKTRFTTFSNTCDLSSCWLLVADCWIFRV